MTEEEEAQQQRLGEELRRLRDEHRINSQKKLAVLSKVSESTIKLIEAGKTATKPHTLMLLARGLATDVDGKVDAQRAETLYARLMGAWGVLPRTTPKDEPTFSRAAFLVDMERRHGQRLALALSTVAWDLDQIPERYRRILETTILEGAGALTEEQNE